ncbi:MAG: hypothetical protein IIW74_06370 [Rikenellaceae bacterium]|nr:hypothetical protein [Rikenellaceae bacterium]
MKKTLLVIMAVLFGLNAMAQTEGGIKVRRPKYVTLGYVLQQDVTLASGEVIKPEFGAMLNRGRTFYLHKKPIGNFLNIGIDATWIDMNYAMYKPQTLESALHQAELAVQVGPSFTFTPVKRLQVHLYGRFAPTFALRYDGEIVGGNYASMFVAGGNLSFGFFGVGAEYRMGNNMNYKAFNFEKIADKLGDIVGGEDNAAEAFVTRTGEGETAETSPFFGTKNVLEGLRVYVTFRF